MAHKVVVVDLSIAHDVGTLGELIPPNQEVTDLCVVSYQPGVNFRLFFGQDSNPIPVTVLGTKATFRCGHNNGIYYANLAQPGKTVSVFVAFGVGVAV